MNEASPLSDSARGGFYIGFNAQIDRRAAEQLLLVVNHALLNKFQTINLLLCSSGGILDHAFYVCRVLDALPVEIVTFNMGSVMSAANLIFLCGDKRYATDGSVFYFHEPSSPGPVGDQLTSSFARSRAKSIARDDARSANFVADKIGRTTKEVRRWHRRELFMDTSAALANGIIHRVEAPVIAPNALFHQVVI